MPKTIRKVAVIGLGYVGLPVAVAFAHSHKVIAFDISHDRIAELVSGFDRTDEVTNSELKAVADNMVYTADLTELKSADFYIVAVPTPVNNARQPDLTPLLGASEIIGKVLNKGDIVVYESTVYPGATEEDCAPILEQASGLKAGTDFYLGYSPERINPGDKENTFTKIKKIVSGQTPEALEIIAQVYSSVVSAGVHQVASIKAAEAAKVIENAQRDLNIAFVNELSKIFALMDIDTHEVLDAAASKWNFVKYNPGLVGGHCIGVDPYYLTYKAQKLGYHPEVLLAGRRINDGMAKYVAQQTVQKMIAHTSRTMMIKDSVVAILGVTFKENCPDIRNSKIFDLISELNAYGLKLVAHDPVADPAAVKDEYGIQMLTWDEIQAMNINTIIVGVGHQFYHDTPLPEHDILIDVKGVFDKTAADFRL